MIDQWLNETIESYFQGGTEKRIFLFFDPVGDYSRIIDHLSENFVVLKDNDGLLKIKYQIEFEAPDKNFVIYLPFSKDSKDISYLKEYLYTGKVFSDTLYTFLKNKKVKFPSEKAKIAEIKKSLPQLALDSIGKGEEYWDNFIGTVSELILPEFREKLLQFFEYPTETYHVLKSENKTDAFQKKMASEYGFKNNIEEPDNYRNNFFSQLCFTEVYYILKKPASFPFKECISDEDKIDNNIKLIKEIRSHNRYQKIYYDLIFQIEKNYDIKTFAKSYSLDPDIETFKIFDLEALRELNDLAQKCEKKNDFIALISKNAGLINKKSIGFWGKEGDIREWSQLSTLSRMMTLIEDFNQEIQNINDEQILIKRYCEKYFEIDQLYRKYITDSNEIEDSLEDIYFWIEKLYVDYLDKLNSFFSEKIFKKEKWELEGLLFQGNFFKNLDLKNNTKTGIIIVDGLRYELGKEIDKRISNEFNVDIKPMYAQIPTDTVVGMASMLSPEKYELDCDPSGILISSNGVPLNNKVQRINYLKSKIEKISDYNIQDFNDMNTKEIQKIKNPILLFADYPDTLLESGRINYIQFISKSLTNIIKGIKRLAKADFKVIYIVSDHGFLAFKDKEYKFKIETKSDFIKDSRRFACGENIAAESLVEFNIPNMKKSLFFPRSIYYFKHNSFLHGGISIQETIIPCIKITIKKEPVKKVDIQVQMEKGISNRIFELKIKPKWSEFGGNTRTIEIAAYYNEDLISSRPAVEIESEEISIMVRILPTKSIPQGDKIKIIAKDQETKEILFEKEAEALVPFEQVDL
jgi:hypothetical protein